MIIQKKYLYPLIAVLATFFVAYLFIVLTKPETRKSIFLNTIPLIGSKSTPIKPDQVIYQKTNTPSQTNINKITEQVDKATALSEKQKIAAVLPIRIDNFKTSTSLSTTINLYSLPSDPESTVRLEIYGLNFNNTSSKSEDALAFRDSFLQMKKTLLSRNLNLQNLQIIYGNRQYIQDTASLWTKEFKLLD